MGRGLHLGLKGGLFFFLSKIQTYGPIILLQQKVNLYTLYLIKYEY